MAPNEPSVGHTLECAKGAWLVLGLSGSKEKGPSWDGRFRRPVIGWPLPRAYRDLGWSLEGVYEDGVCMELGGIWLEEGTKLDLGWRSHIPESNRFQDFQKVRTMY